MESYDIKFFDNIVQVSNTIASKHYPIIPETGYVSMMPWQLFESLSALLKKGEISRGLFLDLGSGLGVNIVTAAYMGFKAYGIEINEALFQGSRELISHLKSRSLLSNYCVAAYGSYFPNAYIDLRKKGESIAVKYEKSDLWLQDARRDVLFPKANKVDIYQQLGISFNDFDVFFCYNWPYQIPSILEMFSLYAKKDAVLLTQSVSGFKGFQEIIKYLGLNLEAIYYNDEQTGITRNYLYKISKKFNYIL